VVGDNTDHGCNRKNKSKENFTPIFKLLNKLANHRKHIKKLFTPKLENRENYQKLYIGKIEIRKFSNNEFSYKKALQTTAIFLKKAFLLKFKSESRVLTSLLVLT